METMATKSLIGAFCGALLLSCSTLVGSQAWAASLQPGQGNLTINQGQGFQPVNGRVDANVGDSVMVGPGGSATVVYDDGCTVNVAPGSVTTVAPLSPCASGSYAADNTDLVGPAIMGLGAAAAIGAGVLASTNNPNTNGTPASP
jgi:hypothetical protein